VYYVGLLAGHNDVSLLMATGEGRDINRHIYYDEEILRQLQRPVVKGLCRLIQLRNTHPAFDGDFSILDSTSDTNLCLRWSAGEAWTELNADFQARTFQITYSEGDKSTTLDASTLLET